MFDTLKLIYTQDEALELVSRYEKVYNEKIEELEKENRKLKADSYNELQRLGLENYELREENKKLKESLDIATKCSSKEEDGIIKLSEENKKLKSDLAFKNTMLDNVSAEYESAQDVIKKLKERIRFLEQCLDNKEKVNKSLREENKRLSDFLECES